MRSLLYSTANRLHSIDLSRYFLCSANPPFYVSARLGLHPTDWRREGGRPLAFYSTRYAQCNLRYAKQETSASENVRSINFLKFFSKTFFSLSKQDTQVHDYSFFSFLSCFRSRTLFSRWFLKTSAYPECYHKSGSRSLTVQELHSFSFVSSSSFKSCVWIPA